MSQFSAIVKKECKDNLRDRRALFSSLSPAIFAPVFLVGLILLWNKFKGIRGSHRVRVIGSICTRVNRFSASQNTTIKEIDGFTR